MSSISHLEDVVAAVYNEWVNTMASTHLPPDIYLKGFGNDACKSEVARWLFEQGYKLEKWPNGSVYFKRGEETLGEFKLAYNSNCKFGVTTYPFIWP